MRIRLNADRNDLGMLEYEAGPTSQQPEIGIRHEEKDNLRFFHLTMNSVANTGVL